MLPTLASASLKPFSTAACPSVAENSPLVRTQPFARFGCWAPSVSVARDGTIGRLARWIALNQHRAATPGPDYSQTSSRGSADQLWRRCQQANPECFRTYRVVALDRPSYFLPADELRREAHLDRLDALRLTRHFGWAFRTQAWLAAKRDAAALFALRTLVRAVEALTWDLAPLPAGDRIDPQTRRQLRREFGRRLERTESLGLAAESRRLELALAELRRRIVIDPVLAFELPDRTGELWFEAHWFVGRDGRTYVHY